MPDIVVRDANLGISIEESIIQFTHRDDEPVAAGAPVRFNVTTGQITNSNATTAAEARVLGVQVKAGTNDGQGRTVIRKGVLDGYNLDALNFDAPIFLSNTDGRLSDTVGTVNVQVGRVIPGESHLRGQTPDKLLFIDL